MKQVFAGLMIFVGTMFIVSAYAETSEISSSEKKPLRETLFTVSSDELDPSESLNRVSGEIDLGFSAPDQTFKSKDHYAPGPFAREKALESS